MLCSSRMPSIAKVKQKIAWTFGFGRKENQITSATTDNNNHNNHNNHNHNKMKQENNNDENERSENKADKKHVDLSITEKEKTKKQGKKVTIETTHYEKGNIQKLIRSPSVKSAKSLKSLRHQSMEFVSTASAHRGHSGVGVESPKFSPVHSKPNLNKHKTVDVNAIIVGERFKLVEKLGKGSFGVAYHGIDLNNPHSSEPSVAIKLQRNARDSTCSREISMLRRLDGLSRVPSLIWTGEFKQYRAMALQLEGPNLGSLFDMLGKQFSIDTAIHCLIECISCVEQVHEHGVVHRDIKPQNFVIGLNDEKKIYVIDFGLSTLYVDDRNKHKKYFENCSPVGTARYASLNTHRGIHQTRRDDLESIGYMIIYFLKSELPWQGVREHNRVKKWRKIEEKKASVTNAQLTNGLPQQFCYYLDYVKKLKFDQTPDYKKLRKMFEKIQNQSIELDWMAESDDDDQIVE